MAKEIEMAMLVKISESVGKINGRIDGMLEKADEQKEDIKDLYEKISKIEKREGKASVKMMAVWALIVILVERVLGLNLLSLFKGG